MSAGERLGRTGTSDRRLVALFEAVEPAFEGGDEAVGLVQLGHVAGVLELEVGPVWPDAGDAAAHERRGEPVAAGVGHPRGGPPRPQQQRDAATRAGRSRAATRSAISAPIELPTSTAGWRSRSR